LAKYTTTLHSLIEGGYDVFLGWDYPIFDSGYRSILNQKIIDTFLFREIGFETAALFKHHLKTKMKNIMPHYNRMYRAIELLDKPGFNPFYNLDTTETHTRTLDSISENTATSSGKDVFSDTPSSKLGNADYATTISDTDVSSSGEGNTKTTEDYVTRTLGSGGMRYPGEIVSEYIESLINVDELILDELNELFMSIY
jgi:hypothetical protein